MKDSPVWALSWSGSGVTCVVYQWRWTCVPSVLIRVPMRLLIFPLVEHTRQGFGLPLYIHSFVLVIQFLKFFGQLEVKKNVLLLCGKKNKREMICALHKSKFKVKLHSWDTSKNSMSLVQWSLNAWKVMAHITTESCLWQKRDKAEFKILNCELKFLQLVKGSFPYAKKYWAWCKHLFSCSGIAGLWAFHIIYQGTTE